MVLHSEISVKAIDPYRHETPPEELLEPLPPPLLGTAPALLQRAPLKGRIARAVTALLLVPKPVFLERIFQAGPKVTPEFASEKRLSSRQHVPRMCPSYIQTVHLR